MSSLCPHNISRRIYVSQGRCCADIVQSLCGHISPGIYVRTMSALYPSSVFSSGLSYLSAPTQSCSDVIIASLNNRVNKIHAYNLLGVKLPYDPSCLSLLVGWSVDLSVIISSFSSHAPIAGALVIIINIDLTISLIF